MGSKEAQISFSVFRNNSNSTSTCNRSHSIHCLRFSVSNRDRVSRDGAQHSSPTPSGGCPSSYFRTPAHNRHPSTIAGTCSGLGTRSSHGKCKTRTKSSQKAQ